MLMRLEYEMWRSGVEYAVLARTTNLRRIVFFFSQMPGASLATHTVPVELMPLNNVKALFFIYLLIFMLNSSSYQLSCFSPGWD